MMSGKKRRWVISVRWLVAFSIATAPAVSVAQSIEAQLKPLIDEIVLGCSQTGARRITVADLTDLQGQVTELGRFLAEEIGGSLVMARPGFGVIDRANLRTILAEHKLSMSGLVNPETAKKLGRIAGVDGILTGTITPAGDTIRISIKVISTETATVVAAARSDLARTKTVDDLLARTVTGESGTGSSSVPTAGRPGSALTFRNNVFEMVVKSVTLRPNRAEVVVRADLANLQEDVLGIVCELALVSQSGERWQRTNGGYWDEDGLASPNALRVTALAPGTPGIATMIFQRPEGSSVPDVASITGRCGVGGRGEQAREVPLVIEGLRISK